MSGFVDFHEAMMRQFREYSSRISALNKELGELRPAFLKYREASAQLASLGESFQVMAGILSRTLDEKTVAEFDANPGIAIKNLKQEKKNTPLWKVIREFARQVIEIRIVEIEIRLKTYGYSVSRQAIESAIDTHEDVFRSARKGRERFVSLK
jgi:predicted metal-dependent hydrolase